LLVLPPTEPRSGAALAPEAVSRMGSLRAGC
jgi:hypothetical protein